MDIKKSTNGIARVHKSTELKIQTALKTLNQTK